LKQSQPYLEYLLDRSAAGFNLNTDDGRVKFLGEMLPVAGRIPDAAMRDRFADRLAFKARVTDEVVRAEIRRAAVQKQPTLTRRELQSFGQVTKAEKGVIWRLIHDPAAALAVLATLEEADLEALSSRSVLDLARKLNEDNGFSPSVLLERLSMVEAQLVTAIASEPEPPTLSLVFCVRTFRRTRLERARSQVQREIERLQTAGLQNAPEMNVLLAQNGELNRQIKELVLSEE
jgi:DNA primase